MVSKILLNKKNEKDLVRTKNGRTALILPENRGYLSKFLQHSVHFRSNELIALLNRPNNCHIALLKAKINYFFRFVKNKA